MFDLMGLFWANDGTALFHTEALFRAFIVDHLANVIEFGTWVNLFTNKKALNSFNYI